MNAISDTAKALFATHITGGRDFGFAARHGITDLANAYRIQDAFVEHLIERAHTKKAGYKVGLTSAAMQQVCGVDQPVAGIILASSLLPAPCTLKLSDYGHLGLEFEIVVRFSRDISGSGPIDQNEIARSVDGICAAIEIVDDRHANFDTLDINGLVAENTWNAGLALGPIQSAWSDLADIQGRVSLDGIPIDEGKGSAVLGHPFASAAWTVNHLLSRGQAIRKGEIISTGSIMKVRFPSAGETYRFELAGAGQVDVRVEA